MGGSYSEQRLQELVEMATTQLTRHMAMNIKNALELLPRPIVESCRALSLVLHESPDDPMEFRIELRATTESQVSSVERAGISMVEAQWSLDHWIDIVLWDFDCVQPGANIERQTRSWAIAELAANGHPPGGDARFAHRIRHMLGRVGASLHESGAIERVFGKNLPVIVQGELYDEWAKEMTAHANPWATKTERRKWFIAS